jgi:hypothetical protein
MARCQARHCRLQAADGRVIELEGPGICCDQEAGHDGPHRAFVQIGDSEQLYSFWWDDPPSTWVITPDHADGYDQETGE